MSGLGIGFCRFEFKLLLTPASHFNQHSSSPPTSEATPYKSTHLLVSPNFEMGDISLRRHIRWLPAPASEPTSTIVLTSPERRFVDIRVLLDAQPLPDGKPPRRKIPSNTPPLNKNSTGTLPLSGLDWAIAGTSTSSDPLPDGSSHCVWSHWISSRTADVDGVADEGDNHPQPDGSVLETGRMVNPATGEVGDYEEVWVSEEIKTVEAGGGPPGEGEGPVCVVMKMEAEGGSKRGMLVRLGQYCQAVVRVGGEVAVERWVWEGDGGWNRTVRIGGGKTEVPAEVATHLGHLATVDDEVRVATGEVWKVVERS